MVKKCTTDQAEGRAETGDEGSPPQGRLRLRLNTIDDVKKELGRLYREARANRVDSQTASRLANMLSILGRLIEGADLEERLARIEEHVRKGGDSCPSTRH